MLGYTKSETDDHWHPRKMFPFVKSSGASQTRLDDLNQSNLMTFLITKCVYKFLYSTIFENLSLIFENWE